MLKKMGIKSQIVFLITPILCISILLQIVLYSILQHESTDTISKVFEAVTENTVSQIKNLNEDIYEISSLLALNSDIQKCLYEYKPVDIVKNQSRIYSLVSDYRNRNKSITFLGIVKKRSLIVSDEDAYFSNEIRRIIDSLPENSRRNKLELGSFLYDNKSYFVCAVPAFPIKAAHITSEPVQNYVLCIYTLDNISYAPYPFIDNSQIDLVITDKNNNIILSADPLDYGKKFNADKVIKKRLHKTLSLKNTDWNITVFMPNSNTGPFPTLSNIFVILMILFNLATLIFISKILQNIITKRIINLRKKVIRITEKDNSYRISYDYKDELSEIATIINQVLDSIHQVNEEKLTAMDNLYNAQILQKETQIFYLHGQLSPHFLYNSLSYIQGISFKYNATEIVQIVSSMSKVFRYMSNNINVSTIKQDLDCAIEYFNVINMRRTNPITISNKIDSSLLEVKCLKMIFQPIIENTLKHAFTVDEKGEITINSVEDANYVIIDISDNGCGIPSSQLEALHNDLENSSLNQLQNSEHVGLVNINMRLKLYYNKECGITISSEEGKGTTTRIVFEKESPHSEITI